MLSEDVLLMGESGKRSVEQASQLLKRFYYVERELMRILGGYLVNIVDWDLKTNLPRHIWQDSLRANALRSRILEMRYPRRDVDQEHDEFLQTYISFLIRCNNDAELLEGVYFVTKKALCEEYEIYLESADELDDAPTIAILSNFIPELRDQITEVRVVYEQLPDNQKFDSWMIDLENCLNRIGGMSGKKISSQQNMIHSSIMSRKMYVPPLKPVRDSKFMNADFHMPPRNPQKFIERQIWAGINHVNEIWAAEIPGLVMWKWEDMPWDFYMDCARWAYDEARHCLMGVRRLKAWGFEAGKDYPVVADHYFSVSSEGELAVLALLHSFEINGPYWKSKMKSEFEQLGDTASSQDFDYDWADESIHLAYGHKWVLHRLGEDMDAFEELKEEVMKKWTEWIAEAHRTWDYQPFMSRIEGIITEIEEKSTIK